MTVDGSATCMVILTRSSWPSFTDVVAGGSTSGPLRVRFFGRIFAVNVVAGKSICWPSLVAVVVAAACHVSEKGFALTGLGLGFASAAPASIVVVMSPERATAAAATRTCVFIVFSLCSLGQCSDTYPLHLRL